MAVLRHHADVRVPPDFGLGLLVTAVLAGLLVIACLAVASIPTEGPRGEARTPDPSTTYIDMPAGAQSSPLATH